MIANRSDVVRGIMGAATLIFFYGITLWRIFKGNPNNKVIECGSITLMVFFGTLALFKIPYFPTWVAAYLMMLVFWLCLLTMFFLLQQGYRAIHDRRIKNKKLGHHIG
jgi:hypothetical protein